jgi:hypothetical protein
MKQDDATESAPDQQRDEDNRGLTLGSDDGDIEDETFVDGWVRKSRASENIDNEMLDLIDGNRNDTSLDEDGLLQALLEHAEEKRTDNHE